MRSWMIGAALALVADVASAECLAPDDIALDLAAGDEIFVARDVDLPEMSFVGVAALTSNDRDERGERLQPTKAGDVLAEEGLCDRVALSPIGRAATYHRPQFAFALRADVDYRGKRPTEHQRLSADGRLVILPKGRYRVVRFAARPPDPGDPIYEAATQAAAGCDGHIVAGSRTLLLPRC
ncbi:MAG: hypothetical protein AAFU55_15120 [Pseudomonadota bacterium]